MAAAVMCTSLAAGFGSINVAAADEVTAESLMAGHFEALSEVESASYNLVLDLDMSMSIFGSSQVMDMDIDMEIQSFGDNAHVSGKMSNRSAEDGEEMLDEQEIEQYVILEGEQYSVYTYDKNSDIWSQWTTDKPTFSLDMIPKFDASGFVLEEEDDRYVVSGDVDLMKTIEALPEMFSDLTQSFGALDGYTGKSHIIYTFDKETKSLTSLVVDMAPALQEILQQSMAEAIAAFGEAFSDSSEEFDISTLFTVDFNNFTVEIRDLVLNQGSEIVLPAEAKEAVETAEEPEAEEGNTVGGAEGGKAVGGSEASEGSETSEESEARFPTLPRG